MGAPVVIATNGIGAPVAPVSANAPVLTIAANGRGTPIVISDTGAPFVVEGYTPPTPLQSFNLNTGSGNGGDIGYYRTIYGSIDSEPLAGFTLLEFATRNSGYFQIAFDGNVLSSVSGSFPIIPGINIGTIFSDWAYDSVGDTTSATWTGGDTMSQPTTYAVTWSN